MSYKKALEILESLPEEKRMLAAQTYKYYDANGNAVCGCVVGKLLPNFYKDLNPGNDLIDVGISELIAAKNYDNYLAADLDILKLDEEQLIELQLANDQFAYKIDSNCNPLNTMQFVKNSIGNPNNNDEPTRKARYHYMVNWLKAKVLTENSSAAK